MTPAEEATVEAVEVILIREWHEDQCACDDFDGENIETCYTKRFHSPQFYPPGTWTVDAVLAAYESARGDVNDEFDVFVRSFNGDEAGDIDEVFSVLGDHGWAMRGGNDVRAVFEKARRALTPNPTVKPDRGTVVASVHRSASLTRDEEGWIADAVLADWPGRTEREVAEAAWDEGLWACQTALVEGTDNLVNPYRTKGADE